LFTTPNLLLPSRHINLSARVHDDVIVIVAKEAESPTCTKNRTWAQQRLCLVLTVTG